jgi:hypothetical protein
MKMAENSSGGELFSVPLAASRTLYEMKRVKNQVTNAKNYILKV